MQCPVCDVTLSISSREGVEIDFCPQCRGVWLDRGELDKVIERAGTVMSAARAAPPPPEVTGDRYDRDERYDRGRDDRHGDPRRRKKKDRFDFLEDLFDL